LLVDRTLEIEMETECTNAAILTLGRSPNDSLAISND
jgi:hypothetical protein